VQYIPKHVAIQSFDVNQSNIVLHDEDNGTLFDCEILSSAKIENKKYIGKGWYDYVRQGHLKAGDTLFFVVENPSDRLYVTVVRN